MPLTGNPLTYVFIGAGLGGVLGAVVGIAIGAGARHSTGGQISTETVLSTQTIRVAGRAGPATSPPAFEAPKKTKVIQTFGTDTTAAGAANAADTTTGPTDTTTTDTTTTDTTTTGTTATTPADPNSVPPANPYRPPRSFCTTHVCSPDFARGTGYAVQCVDGIWTMQGGHPGACRREGGVG